MQITFKTAKAAVLAQGRGSYLIASDCGRHEKAVFVELGVMHTVKQFDGEFVEGQYGRERQTLADGELYRASTETHRTDAEIMEAANAKK